MNAAPKSVRPLLRGLLPALIAGSLGACKDEIPEPSLPPATQTGANTMGCKIDGRNWKAVSTGLFSPEAIGARIYDYQGKREFTLRGVYLPINEDHPYNKTTVKLLLENLRQTGEYELRAVAEPNWGSGSPSYGGFTNNHEEPSRYYYTSPDYAGRVVITRLDTIQHIVSGTFEFKAKERLGSGEVSITDGRFDVKYK